MDLSAYVFDISIYGVLGQFVINTSTAGPPGPQGPKGDQGDQGVPGFLTEASTGEGLYWVSGKLDVSIDAMDYVYVDGSLALRDASITYLFDNKQDTITDGTFVKEVSLGDGLVWNAGMLDVSMISMDYDYVDGSLAQRDASIQALFDAPQDPSIQDLYGTFDDYTTLIYVDGSLALRDASITYLFDNKQDTIIDGTFVKESSLGTDFAWQGGLLDVSIDTITALQELTDVSITGLVYDDILQYNPNEQAPNKWKNRPPADATQWFYTKSEIDAMFALIIGGNF